MNYAFCVKNLWLKSSCSIKNVMKYIPNDFDYTDESAKKLKEDILENKDY